MLYVCIPVHNEAATIGVLLWRIRAVLQEYAREYEVVVYDDGSTDETPAVLDPYRKVLPLTVLRGERRLGTAGAVDALCRHVVAHTRYPRRDGAVLMQGDFTDRPEDLLELAKRFEGGADLIVGRRPASDGQPAGERRLRQWAPRVLRLFVRVADVDDLLTGFRLVRVSVLRDAARARGDAPLVHGAGWTALVDFALAVTPYARRIETVELPGRYDLRPRASRLDWWEELRGLTRYAWRARGRRVVAGERIGDRPDRGERAERPERSPTPSAADVAERPARTERTERPARLPRERRPERGDRPSEAPGPMLPREGEAEAPARGPRRRRPSDELPPTARPARESLADQLEALEEVAERPTRGRRGRRGERTAEPRDPPAAAAGADDEMLPPPRRPRRERPVGEPSVATPEIAAAADASAAPASVDAPANVPSELGAGDAEALEADGLGTVAGESTARRRTRRRRRRGSRGDGPATEALGATAADPEAADAVPDGVTVPRAASASTAPASAPGVDALDADGESAEGGEAGDPGAEPTEGAGGTRKRRRRRRGRGSGGAASGESLNGSEGVASGTDGGDGVALREVVVREPVERPLPPDRATD